MIENITLEGTNARGFYSPAKKIDLGNSYLIFVSGIQPAKDITNINEQTISVFEKIKKILENAGATFDDVVKAQIFLTDIKDFEVVSEIRKEYFQNSKPVSTLLEVNGMTESNSKIEIEVTAIIQK